MQYGNLDDHQLEKAKAVRALILDVDGVFTTGTIYYGPFGVDLKGFNIKDGLGIKLLQRVGIKVGIISAKNSKAVLRRMKELKIEHIYLGFENKTTAYESIKNKLDLSDHEIAYMGDDLPDLPLLLRVGLAVTVPSATPFLKQHVDLVTQSKGGKGAVRELCELILKAQGLFESAMKPYLL
jgi:3-deoxy-D-manno-octulosonate 8-phosphate phosphatase (KDO 8-P phosphatase)